MDGVVVTVDGARLDEHLAVRTITRNGFEWSYEGPEPAQLALAILVDHLGDNDRALALHEEFMRRIVANFDNDWEMTEGDIDEALANIGAGNT